MSYHARLTEVIDAYIANSKRTQEAQEEFNAASELLNKAEQNLNDAIGAEDVAFAALMQLRQDVLDGGYDAPAVEPAPVSEAVVEEVPVEAAPVIEAAPETPVEAPVEVIPASEYGLAPAEQLPVEAPPAEEMFPEPVVEIAPEPVAEDVPVAVEGIEAAPAAEGEDHFITDEF